MLKLKELRKLRGMTQEQLGTLVGASKASISFYETGRQEPSIDMLKRLADALEVTTDTVLGYETISQKNVPHTNEASILATGIDKLPREQREQALNVVKAMFSQYADYFEEGTGSYGAGS